MAETQSSVNISTRLERIAKLAKEAPTMAFRTLAHHIDIDFMREAHRLTRKEGAVGASSTKSSGRNCSGTSATSVSPETSKHSCNSYAVRRGHGASGLNAARSAAR